MQTPATTVDLLLFLVRDLAHLAQPVTGSSESVLQLKDFDLCDETSETGQ